jgi:signal transduction histidine kinase
MNRAARLYIFLVIACGACCTVYAGLFSHSELHVESVFCLVGSIVGSGVKLRLPGIKGSTVSIGFFFVLIAVAQLSWIEAIVIGSSAVLWQYIWQSREKRQLIKMAFNLAATTVTVSGSFLLFGLLSRGSHLHASAVMVATGVAYFVLNTGSVAVVMALSGGKNLARMWRDYYFCSFPYYLIGSAVTSLTVVASKWIRWQIWVLIIPVMYVVFRTYRLYLDQLEATKQEAQAKAQFLANMSHEIRTRLMAFSESSL